MDNRYLVYFMFILKKEEKKVVIEKKQNTIEMHIKSWRCALSLLFFFSFFFLNYASQGKIASSLPSSRIRLINLLDSDVPRRTAIRHCP